MTTIGPLWQPGDQSNVFSSTDFITEKGLFMAKSMLDSIKSALHLGGTAKTKKAAKKKAAAKKSPKKSAATKKTAGKKKR